MLKWSDTKTRRRYVIASVVGLTVLLLWVLLAPRLIEAADGAATETTGRHDYKRPARMHAKFDDGDYGNARGTRLPPRTFRLAKRYCTNHPAACPPRSTPTGGAQRGEACDTAAWDWLEWTCRRLETTSCLAVIFSGNWLGCDSQPQWVHDVRRVEVICAGDAIIAFFGKAPPVVAGAAGHCLWKGVYETWIERFM